MTAEENPIAAGIVLYDLLELKRQFEARALPGEPLDVAPELAVELFELCFSIRTRGNGDGPIGMQVINMVERKERVQRGIDRRRDFVRSERGDGIVADHLIFEFLATIELFQLFETVETPSDDLPAELLTRCTEVLSGRLTSSFEAGELADGLLPVMRTPLGPLAGQRTLADIPTTDRLAELEF